MHRVLWILVWVLLACNPAIADPFLQPQRLPDDFHQINFEDSQTGQSIPVRLDENHLPIKADFFSEGTSIPFYIEGMLIDSRSGNQLHAWQVIPKSQSNGVSILFLHGNGGHILSNLGSAIALIRAGFKVTLLDYSGFGYSGGKASRKNVIQDAETAVDLIFTQPESSAEKRVIYGQSLGGHLAVVVAARNQSKVDGLVIEGAFSSHKAIAAAHKGKLGKLFVSEPYSAEESIAQYTKPILIIHSTEDEVVPYPMGETLFELANQPKELFQIDGAHLAGLSQHRDQIAQKIQAMMGTQ